MFSFKEWYIKGTKFGSVKALEKILETVTTLFKFDGTAYTDANGERFLENVSGTQDIKLVSGRGLQFNGVDQTFNLGTMTAGNNSTFIFTVEEVSGVNVDWGYLVSRDYNYVIGINPDGTVSIRWNYGTQRVTFSNIVVDLSRPITLAIVFGNDGEGIHTCMYEGQIGYAQADTGFAFAATNMYLASRGNVASFSQVIFRSVINLPEYSFTQQDFAAHLQNPERTVYLENSVLKSDILPQATLDSMAAGNGFAYLMTENISSRGYLTDITKTKADNLLTDPLTQIDANSAFTKLDAINGVYSINTTSYKDLRFSISGYTEQFIVVEWEIFDYVGGDFFINLDGGTSVVNSYAVSGNGFHRKVLYNTDNTRVDLSTHGYFNGSIRNIYVAPLNNSNIAAVENWSSTMHTNVADHSHGIQTALLDQDIFGVPTGLTSIDVQAKDFADAQTQFSNENGLALTDNEGTLELRVSYPSEIATEDGQVIQTEDGQTLEV
jgi:hypothetical protein